MELVILTDADHDGQHGGNDDKQQAEQRPEVAVEVPRNRRDDERETGEEEQEAEAVRTPDHERLPSNLANTSG